MNVVHVQNTVKDFELWKASFDRFEAFRVEQGVQSYRVSRGLHDPNNVIIDLLFADTSAAEAFLPKLAKVMASPQAQEHLVTHAAPTIYEVVTDRVPSPAG